MKLSMFLSCRGCLRARDHGYVVSSVHVKWGWKFEEVKKVPCLKDGFNGPNRQATLNALNPYAAGWLILAYTKRWKKPNYGQYKTMHKFFFDQYKRLQKSYIPNDEDIIEMSQ